jgi:S-adenosylmethionine uptake transporter
MQSLWMLFASFTFALMGVCVKLAAGLYSTAEIVMYRGGVGVLVMLSLILVRGGTLRTHLPLQHLWRGVIGVISLWLWFYSFSLLPLATAMTLNYTAPIWIAAFMFTGALWRGQSRFEWGLLATILLSFAGVMLLLQPSMHAEQLTGAIFALSSGMLSAFAYMQVKHLGQLGEPEYRVVFYFSVTGTLAGLAGTLWHSSQAGGMPLWHPHSGKGLALLLAIGVCATLAQMAMTRAYRLGKMLVTANLQYTGIVFSSVFGILIWDDRLSWIGWLGIGVILVSGIGATFYNSRLSQRTVADKAVPASDPIAAEA